MKNIIIIAFALFAAIAHGQKFSLEDAKAYALENNLSVSEANNAIEIARLKIIETRGMGLPQISIDGSFNNFINRPVSVLDAKFFNPNAPEGSVVAFQAGTEYTSTGKLQVNQLIFNGSYIVGLQASKFFEEFQKDVTFKSKEDVIFKVIQAYELVAVVKQNLVFADSLVITTEKLIEKQQNYLELGLMTQEDMDQLNYSLINAKSVKTSAEINHLNALNMLKLAMGYPMSDSISISNSLDELLEKKSISNGDIHSNISYSILEKQVKLTSLDVKNNKFANLPTLNAFFQQSYNAFRNEFNFFANEKWYQQTLWGLQLNIPIFSGMSRYARTSQAKVRLMNTENQLTQLEQSLQFQELQLKNNLRGAQSKYDLQEENVALAYSIYNNAITKEKIGKGNSIQVTQKHNQLMIAQAQYIGSMIDLFNAKLTIEKLYNNILSKQ